MFDALTYVKNKLSIDIHFMKMNFTEYIQNLNIIKNFITPSTEPEMKLTRFLTIYHG